MPNDENDSINQEISSSCGFIAALSFILIIVLIITIIKRLRYKSKSKYSSSSSSNCPCQHCISRLNRHYKSLKSQNINTTFYIYLLILVLSIITFIICANKVKDMVYFDPYEILDIPASSTKQEIKLAYKQWARKYHPDKSTLPDAKAMFIKITNAYKSWTNEQAIINYELYGHPDGGKSQRWGLALPLFLFKGNVGLVILLILGIWLVGVLPFTFLRWFNNSKKYNESGMLINNLSIYYYFMCRDTPRESIPFILCWSNEYTLMLAFSNDKEKKLLLERYEKYKKYYLHLEKLSLPDGNIKAIAWIYSHLLNEEISYEGCERDLSIVWKVNNLLISNFIHMCKLCTGTSETFQALKRIKKDALTFDIKSYTYKNFIDIIMVSQQWHQRTNISLSNPQLLQLPNIDEISLDKVNNFDDILKSSINNNWTGLPFEQVHQAQEVLKHLPKYTVITKTKLAREHDNNVIDIKLDIIRETLDKRGDIGFWHSCTYPNEILETVCVVISDDKKEIVFDVGILQVENKCSNYRSVLLPKNSGKVKFNIELYSMNYLSCDSVSKIEVDVGDDNHNGKVKIQPNNIIQYVEFCDNYCQDIPYFTYEESDDKHPKKD